MLSQFGPARAAWQAQQVFSRSFLVNFAQPLVGHFVTSSGACCGGGLCSLLERYNMSEYVPDWQVGAVRQGQHPGAQRRACQSCWKPASPLPQVLLEPTL